MGRLTNKVALITGGGTGIGLGIAQAFATEGAGLCLTGRREARLREAAAGVGGGPERVIWRIADVRDPLSMRGAVEACIAQFGRLDLLVCNAGASIGSPRFDQTSKADWDLVMGVNFEGVIHSVQAALDPLRKARGSIVIISSTSGLRPGGSSSAYAAAKAAVNMLGRSLARDYAPDGVRVNMICPGWIETEMAEQTMTRAYGDRGQEAMEAVGRKIPLGRIGQPEDIALAALYLAQAQWVTGSVLVVDGGSSTMEGHEEYAKLP